MCRQIVIFISYITRANGIIVNSSMDWIMWTILYKVNELDFAAKTNDKKLRSLRGHFQVRVEICKICINIFLTVKILLNITNGHAIILR